MRQEMRCEHALRCSNLELLRHKGSVVERNRKEVLGRTRHTIEKGNRAGMWTWTLYQTPPAWDIRVRMNNWQVDPILIAALCQTKDCWSSTGYRHEKDWIFWRSRQRRSQTKIRHLKEIIFWASMTVNSPPNHNNNTVCPAGDAIKQLVQQSPRLYNLPSGAGLVEVVWQMRSMQRIDGYHRTIVQVWSSLLQQNSSHQITKIWWRLPRMSYKNILVINEEQPLIP